MYVPRWLAAVSSGLLIVIVLAAFQAQVLGKAEPVTAFPAFLHPSRLQNVTTAIDQTGVVLAPSSGRGFVVTHIGFATDTGTISTTSRPVLEMDGVPLFVLPSSGVDGFGTGFHTTLGSGLGSGLSVPTGSVLTLRLGSYVPVGQVVTLLGYAW